MIASMILLAWLACWLISWSASGFIASRGSRLPFETGPRHVPYLEQLGMHAIQFVIAPLLVVLAVVTLGQNAMRRG